MNERSPRRFGTAWAAWAACAILLAGCLDFESVTRPSEEEPAWIQVSALFLDHPVGPPGSVPFTTSVSAMVLPGVDARGPRTIVADTLWVGDRPVVPAGVEPGGARHYTGQWRGETGAEVRFELPRIDRVNGTPPALVWFPVRKLDPDTMRLPRGRDLVLRLASAATWADSLYDSWALSVNGGIGSMQVSGRGATPDSLVIPAALLTPVLTGNSNPWIHVILNSRQSRSFDSAQRDLQLRAEFVSSLTWLVETLEAATLP